MRNIEKLLKVLSKNRFKFFILLFILFLSFFYKNSFAVENDDYVGSDKCEECHKERYDGWENTLHSHVVRDAKKNPTLILGDFSNPRIRKFLEEAGISKKDIDYTVGSHWKQRYLIKKKDEYYALPIVWSIITERWDKYSVSFWDKKPYSKYCIGCHTTNYNPETRSYVEHRVGCEACHGPGRKHVESPREPELIVHPARLKQERRDMICASCHVKGKDKTKKYRFPVGYIPGENLADYMYLRVGIDETVEEVILSMFTSWKNNRKSPKECAVCGIDKPSLPSRSHDTDELSIEFCFGCHDFKDNLSEHTHHSNEVEILCDDCHKVKKEEEKKLDDERNIHSYDFYLVHKMGCYDPYIEKQCLNCHEEKTIDWATPFIIDWAVPSDFIHNE
jgi:hypothetical protein